VKIQGKFVNSA